MTPNQPRFTLPPTHVQFVVLIVCLSAWCGSQATTLHAVELRVGAARTSITPGGPVALSGQFAIRIAKDVESPVTANVMVPESHDGDKTLDLAIMVSCDLVVIGEDVQSRIRKAVAEKLPVVDAQKLFVNITHTQTAPVMVEGKYVIPAEGVMQPADYVDFLVEQVRDAVVDAWNARQPAGVSWGLSHAVVAQNRRSVYSSGTAAMYGSTHKPEFRGIEGYEDHDIDVLSILECRD
ncbi:hypothetical protein Pla52o_15830 [Novipirellula galeiformis]|uniref:Uncharacterized protein n=1 Tax=Novipirellula galeiformis TaxID=2528004 RepID=A0A5C6CMJ0_9BACT|nr:hypothetical protein [Novipirellula galeiformis]TWU25285.1 hypothetical protein Pla52o_15830 [Novipirellula galeiformis]